MNPAFNIGREIGNNFGNVRKQANDESVIENILSQSMQSNDPAVLQQNIGKILSQVSPERQPAALQYLQGLHSNIQKKQETARKEAIEQKAAKEGGYTYGAPPAVQVQQLRNQQPKPEPKPVGGYGAIPPTPEMAQAITKVIRENPNANADDLSLAFANAQIPQSNANPYIENRRRQDETRAKNDVEEKKADRKEVYEFHKESEKYDEELMKQERTAKKQVEAIKGIKKAINSGNVNPLSISNIFKGLGPIGDKISEAFINNDQAALNSSIPQLLEGWKEVFGVRLTDADLRILQDKLPSISKSPEANKAVLKILDKYAEMTLLRGQIAAQIKKNNKGLRPLGYAQAIEERFDEMTVPVKIINPETGREIEIPAYKLSDAIEAGASLAPPKYIK